MEEPKEIHPWEEASELTSLEGTFVEIFGLEERIAPILSIDDPDEGDAGDPVDANGCTGRVMRHYKISETYVILTFDSLCFAVPEKNVRGWEPPDPLDGGFDLLWPVDVDEYDHLGPSMVDILTSKGYCVVQMWMSAQDREEADADVKATKDWTMMNSLHEAAYMGRDNVTKHSLRPEVDPNEIAVSTLTQCDSLLTRTALELEPYDESFGTRLWGRMNGMLRIPWVSPEEADDLRPNSNTDAREERVVFGHIQFLERRKLLMMCLINNSGGELQLYPPDESGQPIVHIPLSQNKLVVFRNDKFGFPGYSYRPHGWSIALQAWLLSEPMAQTSEGNAELPAELQGRRAHVMSATCNFPGCVSDPDSYWSMFTGGTDAHIRVPSARFDIDLYYQEGHDDNFTYASHGAFCSTERLMAFDNQFFRITEREAALMSPGQRLVLETGYDVLQRLGRTRDSMSQMECGVFVGDSGSPWKDQLSVEVGAWHGDSKFMTGSRLTHCLNLVGPCTAVDTACSSSLVAVNLAHIMLKRTTPDQIKANAGSNVNTALATGVNLLLSHILYIRYCGPSMLSPRGRCFTFDTAADGFARGEGCGGLLLQASKLDSQAKQMLACLVGSAVNQDGRSASMTAPHGPSQQECVLASMKELGLSASEITMAECHGTGTALGDPIEVSALRMVMQKRDKPILSTSTKTNVGHLEAGAGKAGILKCIFAAMYSSCPPNVHLQLLNPHMDTNAYPVYMVTEITDFGISTSIAGVSSFGFGGTNARGDVWSRCLHGNYRTTGLETGRVWDQQQPKYERILEFGHPGPQDSDALYINGSWDKFAHLVQMTRNKVGDYTTKVQLRDARREHFHIILNSRLFIHPVTGGANQQTEIQGPDDRDEEDDNDGYQKVRKTWVLNGKEDGSSGGTLYQIIFTWTFSWELGNHMAIRWQPTNLRHDDPKLPPISVPIYQILGTWCSWMPQPMEPSREVPGLYTANIRMGRTEESFQFLRDGDWDQVIHPAVARATKPSVPVQGPAAAGREKSWLLRGQPGDVRTVSLHVLNGEITVTVGNKVWRNTEDEVQSTYFVTGTWNNWELSPMVADPADWNVFTYPVRLGSSCSEQFQIVKDQDWNLRLYPSLPQARLGQGRLVGPDADAQDDLTWLLEGTEGQEFTIVLDVNKLSSRGSVCWRAEREDVPALAPPR